MRFELTVNFDWLVFVQIAGMPKVENIGSRPAGGWKDARMFRLLRLIIFTRSRQRNKPTWSIKFRDTVQSFKTNGAIIIIPQYSCIMWLQILSLALKGGETVDDETSATDPFMTLITSVEHYVNQSCFGTAVMSYQQDVRSFGLLNYFYARSCGIVTPTENFLTKIINFWIINFHVITRSTSIFAVTFAAKDFP